MDKIEELLTRGVDSVYPSKDALEKLLRSGKKLKLYQGFDPTGTQLHIGHMIGLRKLRHWQDLGHHVVFLIGDGTGQAGDPSGKTKSRETFFTREQLHKNAEDYVKQASKIVKFDGENPVEILYNGDWLNKLKLVDVLNIANHFTLQQMIERDLFQDRIAKGEPLNLREFLYPLLQGYDSVAMNVDLELGGSEQLFNMLCGRTLVKGMLGKEKFVMTTPLLTDSQGRKIGKTEGNAIALTDNPKDLFGKIMALPDEIIIKGFEYLTSLPVQEIETIHHSITNGDNPIIYKKQLAYEITKQLNDTEAAKKAQEAFENNIQRDELPTDIPTVSTEEAFREGKTVLDILSATKLAASRSEGKSLIQQGGVEINGKRITDPKELVNYEEGLLIKVGRRRFIKVTKN